MLILFPYNGLGAHMLEQGLQQDLKMEHIFHHNNSFRRKTQLRHDIDHDKTWTTGSVKVESNLRDKSQINRRRINHGFIGSKLTDSDDFIDARLMYGNRRRRGEKMSMPDNGDSENSRGWVPALYPNPLQSPDQCQIQSFLETNTNEYENFSKHLYLCDPDEIIMLQSDIARVANKLWNFTFYYGGTKTTDDLADSHCNDKENEIVRRRTTDNFEQYGVDLREEPEKGKNGHLNLEIGVAIVDKIDIAAVMNQEYRFYYFDDREEMISDAGQFFASYVHNSWWDQNATTTDRMESCKSESGILIFIAVEDRVCFISAGNRIANLPWWRLEKVVSGMTSALREFRYADAIIDAIDQVSLLIDSGPPSTSELFIDFFARFGFVLIFASLTFVMAVFGEHRDRQSRYRFAEKQSELDSVEKEKARNLQKEYKTSSCPICLEDIERNEGNIDDYGIPVVGPDGLTLKMLRCGHIFCSSCWRNWISADQGDPYKCPVCRQEVSSSSITEQTPLNNGRAQLYGTSMNMVGVNDENVNHSQVAGQLRRTEDERGDERGLLGASASHLNELLMDL